MLKKETFVFAYIPRESGYTKSNLTGKKSNTDVTFSYEIAYVLIIGSPPMINTKDKNIYLSSPL